MPLNLCSLSLLKNSDVIANYLDLEKTPSRRQQVKKRPLIGNNVSSARILH